MFLAVTGPRVGFQTPRRHHRLRAAACILTLVTVAGRSSDGGVETELPIAAATGPSPSVTSSTASDEAEILAAYREFFARQAEISLAPKEQRRVLLEPFTTDPALERVLRGMFAADQIGEVGYGEPIVNPSVQSVDGDTATVTDCQDTSKTGRKKRATGKVTTRGLKRDNVSTTMLRGEDGVWRVSAVDYVDQSC